MEIIKVISIAIVGVVSIQLLKETKSPIAAWVSIAVGIIIIIFAMSILEPLIYEFNYIADKTNINQSLYSLLLKIIGVGYLVEYTTSLCEELQCVDIAKNVSFAGKIIIFALSMPIIKNVFNLIIEIL